MTLEAYTSDVLSRFSGTSNGGVQECRKIANSNTWSQHAWGNAVDVMVPNLATGDRVYAWTLANKSRYGLGSVLWRVKDHYDHVHVEGLPKQTGTPPCASGGSTGERSWWDNLVGLSPLGFGLNVASGNPLSDLPTTIRRVAWFGAGAFLTGFGLVQLSKALTGFDPVKLAKELI